MKTLSLSLAILMLAAALCACGVIPDTQSSDDCYPALKYEWTVTDGITIKLPRDVYPVGTESFTFALENRTDTVLTYGQGFCIEKYDNGEWKSVETIENYGFTAEGYVLFDHSKAEFAIPTWFLASPLTEGVYRATGCPLFAYPDAESFDENVGQVEYPAYRLEFRIAKDAPALAAPTAAPVLSDWELREKEDWEWYTTWDCVNMYERAGLTAWQTVRGNDGLVAVLWREGGADEVLEVGEELKLDVFNRKTGARYKVFETPAVTCDTVTASGEGGFDTFSGNTLYYLNEENCDIIVTATIID